jgi:archaellum component FlaC
MPPGTTDNGNGRVLAIIDTKLDNIKEDVSEIKTEMSSLRSSVANIEKTQARYDVRIETLEAKSKTWDIGNSILGVVAAVAAAFGIVNK